MKHSLLLIILLNECYFSLKVGYPALIIEKQEDTRQNWKGEGNVLR